MTPIEILDATIKGLPTPRIPVFCNLLDQGARELGLTQQAYYAKGEHVAEGQLKMRARYGYDNVWSLFYVGKEAELLGCNKILFSDSGAPNVEDFVIKDYDDIAKLEVPNDITDHPAWEETAKCLAILREEAGAKYPVCAYLTASTTLPSLLMGMDKWLELLLTGPDDLRDELVRKCSDFFQKEIAAYRAAGANILIYSSPFGSPYFVDMKRFHNFSMPWMKRDLEPGGVTDVIYYCGMAPFNKVIEDVIQNLGITTHYISPLADLAEAKSIIGSRGLTCGVIDDIKMIHWTAEETRAEVKRLCKAGKAGGHFLLGTGLMPSEIPAENITALINAAFEYGSYL
ncbi:uroporphyrinogen decarboxylase family protein [Methylicorpusculum oleiharenae]|uniref:uroporphyrinogen decarboxylase family protein n=1 Tax=Methylicorpusculum oleiharenae TaxID=1338687 RepID=UPI00135C5592|nr:uroporphyrinogen decarboxylase family protein [Methylicorpusculum oleiharenae]MCD2450833.1 uroporphyrinogen decarboxylase family protein [Methylicorpusculum oleiharenae]